MDIQKRFLLKGGLPTANLPLPPYFQNINDFINCLNCSDTPCVEGCEEGIIQLKEGFPYLNFFKSGCTFCDKCAQLCPNEVLKVEWKRERLGSVIIDPNQCLAWQGVVCSSCQDICEENAIGFIGGMFKPVVDEKKCTGCGFCISVCPNPISIQFWRSK